MSDQSKIYLQELVRLGKNSFKSFAYEAITVTGTLARLTVPTDAKYAVLVLESTAVGTAARCLQNLSVAVTSTVGIPLIAGSILDVTDHANLDGFQIIKDQAGTTTLHVEYYK